MTNSTTMKYFYYRPLKLFGGKIFKCAGHGAETQAHREFYLPFFEQNQDNDTRFLPGCRIARYCGDRPSLAEILGNQQ